jgi:hypothetical protein
MSSTKTTNITLALAISAALTTVSQVIPATAHPHHSTPSNGSIWLASAEAVPDVLPQAKAEERQWKAYSNSQYTFEDADILANFWGKPTPWDAKLKIGALLLSNNNATVKKALQNAQQQAKAQARLEEQQWEAYSDSQYSYEDVAILADFWGQSDFWETKLKIGSLLMSGNEAAVQKALQNAQQQPQAPVSLEDQQWETYSNSKYSFDDAALLADFWGKSDPWEAKLKIGSLLMSGNEAAVQKALQNVMKEQQ